MDRATLPAGLAWAGGSLDGLPRGDEPRSGRDVADWSRAIARLAATAAAGAGAGPGPAASAATAEIPGATLAGEEGAAALNGWITHYGESYAGGPLGCGVGVYDPADPTIVAVGPARYTAWPCGTRFRISGPAGAVVGVRVDACPGCGANHLDVSEAAAAAICGYVGNCEVTIEVLE